MDPCPRCRQPVSAPHESEAACIGALGAALALVQQDLEAVKADLAARQARDEAEAALHVDLDHGG